MIPLCTVEQSDTFERWTDFWRRRKEQELADAREEALRWYDLVSGQITNLSPGDTPATKQVVVRVLPSAFSLSVRSTRR
ncbi:hypothetical protein AB0H83_44885 [Dactylosporangium sp. NPDC050688]|uniref:hypothetical protein n=1 Tax=Dactylosporangium sp. NPDC050688 TaxID=3157217 RepID=UPI0033EC7D62